MSPDLTARGPTNPRRRPSARVILLDLNGRILLFRSADGGLDVPSLWAMPGGGLEDGEGYEEAALRELTEETGLTGVPLSRCVWIRRHVWRWGEEWIESTEHYFVVNAPKGFTVSTDTFTENERRTIKEFRWWTPSEIALAVEELFVPRQLAQLLSPLLAGNLPPEPIDPGI